MAGIALNITGNNVTSESIVSPVITASEFPVTGITDGEIGLSKDTNIIYRYYSATNQWHELPFYFLINKLQFQTNFLQTVINKNLSNTFYDNLSTLNNVNQIPTSTAWDGYFVTGSGIIQTNSVNLLGTPSSILIDVDAVVSGGNTLQTEFTTDGGATWNVLPYVGAIPSGNTLSLRFTLTGSEKLSGYALAYL